MRTPLLAATLRGATLLVFALMTVSPSVYSQYSCSDWVDENGKPLVKWDPLRQRVVTNQTIPGNNLIHNWLEFLPDDYNSTSKRYPLIIFFHGTNEGGNGSPCRLLEGEWWWTPPVIIERKQFPYSSKDQNGNVFKFIVISPRMDYFGETTNTINTFIDYLVRRYRVDPGRVYLTGISSGSNYIVEYAGSSEANARKVAGIMPVSPCFGGINTTQATNISRAGLHVYSVSCGEDDCGGVKEQATKLANAINSIDPSKNLAWASSLPLPGWPCNSYLHDSWGTAYDSSFKVNIYGRTVNMYEWALQFTRTAAGPLPVQLEDFSIKLQNGKVYVRWSTSAENNSDHFTLERAGSNQQFSTVATLPAAGNSGSRKTYEWIDEQPLANINFYRLSQTDIDGQKEYFPVRKILNRKQWDRYAVVSPNPFGEELSVFLNVDRTQRVAFTLADMSGRTVSTMNAIYNEGTAEVKFDARKMPRGIYFLKIEGEYFSEVQRVVKQ